MPSLPRELTHYWADPRMYATTLLTLFTDVYGTEGFNWHPATIQMEIEADFGVDLPTVNYERLLTAISLITTNTFFTSVPDFLRTCVVLSGHEPGNSLLLPDAADLAWGITEALLIEPPPQDNESPFHPEITAYIGHVLDSEGILNPPDILRLGTRDQSLVDRVNYDYSDDNEMFQGIWDFERSKTEDINYMIKGRMRGLITQLQSLPLAHGKVEGLAKKVLANLKDAEDLPLPM